MSASALPQELIEEIIDAAEDDLQSLKAFGLVGKRWTQRTRKYLFHKIELIEISNHPLDPTTRCKQLVELLEANGELCKHTRILIIQSSTVDPDAEEKDRNLGWLQVCSEDVIKVLQMLCRSVNSIAFCQGKMAAMNFAHLSPPLREALQSFVARPDIIDLSLFGVHSMEMTSLAQNHSMEKLLIAFSGPPRMEPLQSNSCIRWQQQPTTTAGSLTSSKRSVPSKKFLEALLVCGGAHALHLLLCESQNAQTTLDFSRIRRVTVGTMHWDGAMTMIWPYFLKVFCQDVLSYRVSLGPWSIVTSLDILLDETTVHFDPVVFSFDKLPRLAYLNVEVPHFSLLLPRHTQIPHLLEGLETLASSPEPVPLRHLTLDFNFGSLSVVDDVTKALAEVSKCQDIWGRLDEILSREVFSSLTKVIVRMLLSRQCKFDQSVEELDELKSTMFSYMPNLLEQSKLQVTFFHPFHRGLVISEEPHV